MYRTCKAIGCIQKTYGKSGEVVASSAYDLSFVCNKQVAIVPPPLKGPRWLEVCITKSNAAGFLCRFKGVDSLNDAEALVGKTLLIATEDLEDSFFLKDAKSLLGMTVSDRILGTLGVIVEVMQGGAQDVWVIDGVYGTILLPIIDSMDVQLDHNIISLETPVGMSDILDGLR